MSDTGRQDKPPMLRPINVLSERIGVNALIRMKRLREEAITIDVGRGGDLNSAYLAAEKRELADLIEEIHRLSNPDFSLASDGCEWTDKDDELSERITADHPTYSGSWDTYQRALELVSNRRKKSALVGLVNHLLVRISALQPET